jgi:hypothetical protein
VFLLKVVIGPFKRNWLIPNGVALVPASPVLGLPDLVSVLPGSYLLTAAGSINFVIPNYNALTVALRGAGGGGTISSITVAATNGGASQFLLASAVQPPGSAVVLGASMVANGGLAGVGPPPADQGGSGGTVTVGGGSAGGMGYDYSIAGVPPSSTYAGSAGGLVTRSWNRSDPNAPPPGTTIGTIIGNGGSPGSYSGIVADPGVPGRIDISWT